MRKGRCNMMFTLNLKAIRTAVLLAFLAVSGLLVAGAAQGFQPGSNGSVAIAELPPEAQSTLQRIKQGGPFPYPRDGVVFGNYEKRLPKRPRGYYHEYTVKTPGVRNRGARRIVCGDVTACYYTDDHYQTFRLIRE